MDEKDINLEMNFDEEATKQDEGQTGTAGFSPEVVKELIKEAVKEAVAATQPKTEEPKPQALPEEQELHGLRTKLAELNERINSKMAQGADASDAELLRLLDEKQKVEARLNILENTLPLKKQAIEAQAYAQLAARIPFRVDQVVARFNKELARFGEHRAQVEGDLRAQLAELGSVNPQVLFDDNSINNLVKAYLGQKVLELGAYTAPYDPSSEPEVQKKRKLDAEKAKWAPYLEAIGLNPDEVFAEVEKNAS